MTPYPDERPREGEEDHGGDGVDEAAEHESGGEPAGGDGVTDEFETEFGEGFGADVADELAIEQGEGAAGGEQAAGGGEQAQDEELEGGGEPAAADELEGADELEDEDQAGGPDPLEVLSQETVEADVVALADEEEARERAEREAAEPDAAAPAAAAAGDAAATTGTAEADAEGAEAPAADAAPVAEAEGPPTEEEKAEELPGVGLWARFLTASLVIVISMATATSVSILLYLSDIARGLGGIKGIQQQLEQVAGGDPQTILILGSDERPGDPAARSDTTMLLRLDPDKDAIALLSLPRDLRVNIPGRGVAKLNEAYSSGGPKKTLQVVKQLTGLKIHHVVNVDFKGFEKAISAIDCVYVDVDRQYFNTNEGLAPSDFFSEIDINAGYQLLCGERALQYVRYRHTDNDLVRASRQQDFLREARQKIGPSRLFRDRDKLINIFKRYTTSDISDEFTMLDVLKTFLGAANAPVKQIHFEGELGKSYVTASNKQVEKAVEQFLGIKDTPGPLGGKKSGRAGKDKKKKEEEKKKKKEKKEKKKKPPPKPDGSGADVIDSTAEGQALAEKFAPKVRFPVFYPTKLAPGSTISDESREYRIEDTDDRIHRAYKFVVSIPGASVPAEFYGVMGITWLDPPILDNPSETREIGGREYLLFYDGDRLRLVGWKTKKAAYWLNNTLLQTLDEDQMLAIADSMRRQSAKR